MVPVYDLLAAIAAAAAGVGALWLLRRRGGADRGGPRGDLITYVGASGIAALVCAVMNILELTGGGVTAAAVGNAANVLAPGLLWAAGRRVSHRRETGVVVAIAISLLMLAATFVVSLEDATLLKTAAIAVFSILAAVEFRRGGLRQAPGTATIATAISLFAAYNLGRIVVAFTAGIDSRVWNGFASSEATSSVSAVVILLITLGALRLGRGLADDPAPGTRAHGRTSLRRRGVELLQAHGSFVGATLRIPDLELIRAAQGTEQADAVMAALLGAVDEVLPEASAGIVSRDTVAVLLPADIERAGVDRRVAEEFAARRPLAERPGAPDIRMIYRGVSDRTQLDAFLADAAGRRTRRGQPAFGG